MQVTIVNLGSGNLHSASKAFDLASENKHKIVVSSEKKDILNADYIVLPGQGAFKDVIDAVNIKYQIKDVLQEKVLVKKTPYFGICVGMQILADYGLEHGKHDGLGWIAGVVKPINVKDNLRIPHMGWNELTFDNNHALFEGIAEKNHVYFVHSYYFDSFDKTAIIASCEYGEKITACIAKDNIVATQFHPEKSQQTGIQIIKNFLKL